MVGLVRPATRIGVTLTVRRTEASLALIIFITRRTSRGLKDRRRGRIAPLIPPAPASCEAGNCFTAGAACCALGLGVRQRTAVFRRSPSLGAREAPADERQAPPESGAREETTVGVKARPSVVKDSDKIPLHYALRLFGSCT